jgi:hypothetical protein
VASPNQERSPSSASPSTPPGRIAAAPTGSAPCPRRLRGRRGRGAGPPGSRASNLLHLPKLLSRLTPAQDRKSHAAGSPSSHAYSYAAHCPEVLRRIGRPIILLQLDTITL